MNVTVRPRVGHYVVTTTRRWCVETHSVTKDKQCSCGGTAVRPCSHIRAVARHLRSGGRRALPRAVVLGLREGGGPSGSTPAACPICGAPVERRADDVWHCPKDRSHYWQWRAEQNGGAVHRFFTQPHPAKVGPFYAMGVAERAAFLEQAARRMHAGGYTPYS